MIKLRKIIHYLFLLLLSGLVCAENILIEEEKYLKLIGNPIVVNALMIIKADRDAVQVKHGEEIRYYSKVELKINDLGENRDRFKLLMKFHSGFKTLDSSNTLTVLCRSIKTSKDGVESYEPVLYRGDNMNRNYVLLYCPGISIDESSPLLIVNDR